MLSLSPMPVYWVYSKNRMEEITNDFETYLPGFEFDPYKGYPMLTPTQIQFLDVQFGQEFWDEGIRRQWNFEELYTLPVFYLIYHMNDIKRSCWHSDKTESDPAKQEYLENVCSSYLSPNRPSNRVSSTSTALTGKRRSSHSHKIFLCRCINFVSWQTGISWM